MYSIEFSLLSCSGKNLKISWKSQGKLREFGLFEMSPSCSIGFKTIANPMYRFNLI